MWRFFAEPRREEKTTWCCKWPTNHPPPLPNISHYFFFLNMQLSREHVAARLLDFFWDLGQQPELKLFCWGRLYCHFFLSLFSFSDFHSLVFQELTNDNFFIVFFPPCWRSQHPLDMPGGFWCQAFSASTDIQHYNTTNWEWSSLIMYSLDEWWTDNQEPLQFTVVSPVMPSLSWRQYSV